MKNICLSIALLALTGLAGCGSGGSTPGTDRPAPQMRAGEIPATPANGESRPGRSYRIAIIGGHGEAVVFQVIEPRTLTGGDQYPLVLEGHGFGGSRQTRAADSISQICLSLSANDDLLPDSVTTGRDGTQFDVPATTLISGLIPPTDIPFPAVLPFSASAN